MALTTAITRVAFNSIYNTVFYSLDDSGMIRKSVLWTRLAVRTIPIIELNNCPKGKRVAPKREPATIWGKLMKCSCGCKFNQRGWNHHNGADGVIEAFTEQIIASDKGFDWYLKAVPDMVKSFMDDTPDDETEKEWHELTQFDLTIEDAKAYVYSFSSRRRVHGWQNIKIRLFV